MSNYEYCDKTPVAFVHGDIEGYGVVKGVATVPMAIIGRMYIIEVIHSNQKLPNPIYPFTTIVMPEIALEPLKLVSHQEQIDGTPVNGVLHGDKHCGYFKVQYREALKSMPEPEKTDAVRQWAKDLYKSGTFSSEVTERHLHQFLIKITSR